MSSNRIRHIEMISHLLRDPDFALLYEGEDGAGICSVKARPRTREHDSSAIELHLCDVGCSDQSETIQIDMHMAKSKFIRRVRNASLHSRESR
jgi:hypothetical protein